jgi:hypothetical protein
MQILDFVILGLATWRLASLFAREAGPFDIFAKFRKFVGVYYNEKSEPCGSNVVSTGIICTWCNSVWFGMFWMVVFFITPMVIWLALPLALSACAIIFDCFVGDSYGRR